MNCIHLHDDGQLYFAEKRIETDPLRYAGFEVRLAKRCTLRSFFRCLTIYPGLVALNPFLETFLVYLAKCPENGCRCDDIDHLALWRTVEIIGHPSPPRMELSVTLAGYRADTRRDIRMYWLENLLDMPLQLGHLNHVVFGDEMASMQFDTVFTLFELIDGICWQLSFHNLPAVCRIAP